MLTAASPTADGVPALVEPHQDGAVLRLHVQPGASADGLAGFHGNSLKVKVRAPATAGKANDAVLGLLARQLAVPRTVISLVSGATSRDKRVRFAGMAADELLRRALSALGL